ncbi:hypothetical protein AX774_g3861 [Zancudomyces culisetae]|uniref:Uncharacterized protein n=1 Tax=Zancudomyces culisetae TaxID=1213189 RepID=A0A1R1PNW6_ZANCU|nr:hypothetical protein AX774_g3861 [Zancudomyces culisetae]|eukprot:OMH82659.1 hypothetical protein AX774_g3861 [Zancudomyces culisetae]
MKEETKNRSKAQLSLDTSTINDNPDLGYGSDSEKTADITEYQSRLTFMENIRIHWNRQQEVRRNKYIKEEFVERALDSENELYSDFVIVFKYTPPSKSGMFTAIKDRALGAEELGKKRAEKQRMVERSITDIISRLTDAGLYVEIRRGISRLERKNGKEAKTPTAEGARPRSCTEELEKYNIFMNENQLLLFVSCSKARIEHEYRKKQYQYGQSTIEPIDLIKNRMQYEKRDSETTKSDMRADSSGIWLAEAERQRLVYGIITGPTQEGGANIRLDRERWVRGIFPLHDRQYNKEWLKKWSTKWFINNRDICELRTHFGEEIAIYFGFLQHYLMMLAIPTVIGVIAFFFIDSFSIVVSITTMLWSIAFTETWERKQDDLATVWGLQGDIREKESRRIDFKPKTFGVDSATGEAVPEFSQLERWMRRAVGLPVMLLFLVAMAGLISAMFALQIFMEDMYDGPFSSILVFLPTVIYSLLVPTFTSICEKIAESLNDFENYEYDSEYSQQYLLKLFTFQFLRDQGSMLLMAWVFLPFRRGFEAGCRTVWSKFYKLILYPFRKGRRLTSSVAQALKHNSVPAANKLQALLIYSVLTERVVSQITGSIIPAVMRWWDARKQIKKNVADSKEESVSSPAGKMEDSASKGEVGVRPRLGSKNFAGQVSNRRSIRNLKGKSATFLSTFDFAESFLGYNTISAEGDEQSVNELANLPQLGLYQARFIHQVTREADLPVYSIYSDYAEMATQFGYVTFYSVAWPLAPLVAFLNNGIELRSDAAKICSSFQRPVPVRANSIGQWLYILRLTAWLGSIANTLLVYQFSKNFFLFDYPSAGSPEDTAETISFSGRTNWNVALYCAFLAEHVFLISFGLFKAVLNSTWPSLSDKAAKAAKKAHRISLIANAFAHKAQPQKPSEFTVKIRNMKPAEKQNTGGDLVQTYTSSQKLSTLSANGVDGDLYRLNAKCVQFAVQSVKDAFKVD